MLDGALEPIALGISGPWGSGKSTVLKLTKAELASRETVSEDEASADRRVLVVETDPWRYDPDVGAKGTLILEILNALRTELDERDKEGSQGFGLPNWPVIQRVSRAEAIARKRGSMTAFIPFSVMDAF